MWTIAFLGGTSQVVRDEDFSSIKSAAELLHAVASWRLRMAAQRYRPPHSKVKGDRLTARRCRECLLVASRSTTAAASRGRGALSQPGGPRADAGSRHPRCGARFVTDGRQTSGRMPIFANYLRQRQEPHTTAARGFGAGTPPKASAVVVQQTIPGQTIKRHSYHKISAISTSI